jgi:hypothetical protein
MDDLIAIISRNADGYTVRRNASKRNFELPKDAPEFEGLRSDRIFSCEEFLASLQVSPVPQMAPDIDPARRPDDGFNLGMMRDIGGPAGI